MTGRLRAGEHCGYRHGAACTLCDARAICDGFHGDYASIFGTSEARPIKIGRRLADPTYFIKEQEKVIHPEDEAWVTRIGDAL